MARGAKLVSPTWDAYDDADNRAHPPASDSALGTAGGAFASAAHRTIRIVAAIAAIAAMTLTFPSHTAAQPAASDSIARVRDVLRANDIPLTAGAPLDLDGIVGSYAVHRSSRQFAIAFALRDGPSADTLKVSVVDLRTGRWRHAAFPRQRRRDPAWDLGSVMTVRQTADAIVIGTHTNPSAGTALVLSRDLVPVTALPGVVLAPVGADGLLYLRSAPHFAPTHSLELWTWSRTAGRTLLYPRQPWGVVRSTYIDSVRAIYRAVGAQWFRTNNHHADPERFDSRLIDDVAVSPDGSSAEFVVRYGGGAGTPAATPERDVEVFCTNVGTNRARCVEQLRVGPAGEMTVSLGRLLATRMRFRTREDTSWRYGMFNRTRTEPPCFVVLLFGPNRTYIRSVSIDSIQVLQFTRSATASPDDPFDGPPAVGERWTDVPRDSVDAARAQCATGRR